ncbi:hypothetical protein BOTCAL_0104g00010 [Botryotinia calthae]|uniref:Uncharacterized protein n=1 Tax=Botryotinia calthae TaxID=38488 RepID=A0A4Y8D5X9_9HELO|nr:hypothetical protein BOTCAL_0104g00010 [Botryotinia calthae]
MRPGSLLQNYTGPSPDYGGTPIGRPRSRTIKAVPRRGQTLADELGGLSNIGSSSSASPSSSEEEIGNQGSRRRSPETPLELKARLQTERLLERHNKYLNDHNVRKEVRPQEPEALSKAQKRLSQLGPVARENTKTAKPSPAEPLSKAQKRVSQPEDARSKTKTSQQPPRSVALGGRYMPVKEADLAPRRVPDPVRTVKPDPLSNGVFATISREYGWGWLRWPMVVLVLAVVAFYLSRWDQENQLAEEGYKRNAKEMLKTKFKVNVERANGDAVIAISSAIHDVAKILLDEDGILGKLNDSPFNHAALSIEGLRREVVESEGNESQPLFLTIDNFIEKNREVDHAWRSFLGQQIEATAELTGIFDGYAKNAGFDKGFPNWIRAAHNITNHDFTDIPQKTYHEGEQILCQILGRKKGPNCASNGKMLKDVYNDLRQGIEKPTIKIPPNTFKAYSAATTDIAKAIKSVLKRWENAADKIEAARVLYKDEHAIGNVEKVVESLEKTSNSLTEAMSSLLVERTGDPEFPAAIKRLAEAKVWIKTLQ